MLLTTGLKVSSISRAVLKEFERFVLSLIFALSHDVKLFNKGTSLIPKVTFDVSTFSISLIFKVKSVKQ